MRQVDTIPLTAKKVGGWQPCEACGAPNARREVTMRAGPTANGDNRVTHRLCKDCAPGY